MILLIIFSPCMIPARNALGSKGFILTYGGLLGDNILTDIAFSPKLTDSALFCVGFGSKLLENKHYVRLEWEGQLVRHWGQNKFTCSCSSCGDPGFGWAPGESYEKSRDIQTIYYNEMNALLVLRWLKFPLERWIDINFAAGEGISYDTKVPPKEVDPHSVNHGYVYDTSKWLNYLMFELTFALPRYPAWSCFYRVHHRSGDFGLINGVANGSNFLGVGIRYDF